MWAPLWALGPVLPSATAVCQSDNLILFSGCKEHIIGNHQYGWVSLSFLSLLIRWGEMEGEHALPSSLHFEVSFPLLSTLSRCSIRKESRDFTMNHQIMNSTTNNSLEEVMLGTCPNTNSEQQLQEKRLKPFPDQYLKCPRCDSTNTKFCYYNNYSLSQPRYFCKGCRRYWTQGGSLRNVPIGGGCRKNKRSYSSCSSVTSRRTQDQTVSTPSSPMLPHLQTQLAYDTNDLTHAFTGPQKPINTSTHYDPFLLNNCNPLNSTTGFLDILRGGGFLRTNTCGYQNLCYGFSLDGNVYEPNVQPVSPLIEGSGVAAMIKQEVTCKGMVGENKGVVVDKQCKQVGTDGNIVMDNGRDYWYGAGTGAASAWHGLINSSLI